MHIITGVIGIVIPLPFELSWWKFSEIVGVKIGIQLFNRVLGMVVVYYDIMFENRNHLIARIIIESET